MAEWEREEIASRVKASVEVRAKLGKRLGGQARFGYSWEGEKLVINEEEAPIRKLMYELFLKEKRKKSVATILNERGYRTHSGGKFHGSSVKRWLRDPISKGLRRTNYSQESTVNQSMRLKPQDEWYFHECPAIVSEELWQKVNDILDEQDRNRKPIQNRRVHLFTNYIFCHCGSRMNVRSRLTHYKCTSKSCTNKIRRDDLEEAFKSRLTEFLSNKRDLETYFNQSESKLKEKESQLELARKKLIEVKDKLKKIIDLHVQGQIPTEAFSEYHAEPYEQSLQLEAQIAMLENEILSDSVAQESTSFIINQSKDIYDKWDTYSRDVKREIIESIVESIVIGTDTIDINLKRLNPPTHTENSFSETGENGEQNPGVF